MSANSYKELENICRSGAVKNLKQLEKAVADCRGGLAVFEFMLAAVRDAAYRRWYNMSRKQEAVLKVEGWVWGDNVDLLEQEGTRWLAEAGNLVLDLSGVRFIDAAGIAMLKRWPRARLVLRDGTPFVQTLLEAYGLV